MDKCRESFNKRAEKFLDHKADELVYAIYEAGFNDGIEVDTGHIPTITEMREMVGGKMENASDRDVADQKWIALTDDDRKAVIESMPDMLDGFLYKWGWLHFAKAIEAKVREKNGGNDE